MAFLGHRENNLLSFHCFCLRNPFLNEEEEEKIWPEIQQKRAQLVKQTTHAHNFITQ